MAQKEINELFNNLKPNSEIAKSHDFLFNSTKPKTQIRLLIRKIKQNESSTEKFMKEYDNYFYNPETYFSENSPMRSGKKREITNISLDLKNKNKITKKNLLNISTTSRKISIISKKDKEISNIHLIDINKFELIDNKRLDSIFNTYKERINERINKSYCKNNSKLPLNISLPLEQQQRLILNNQNIDKRNKNMLNFLSKKIKKDKDDLIMNNIDNFLYKREFIDEINNNSNKIYEPNIRYKWTASLRNPDKLKGVRKTLVNINNDKRPFWGFFIEKSANLKQTSIKPGMYENNRNLMNFIKKAKSFKECDDNNISSVKNLDDISVKGENLFNIEYNREMSSKKKKILHKAFVENGKVVLNTEINNIFGKETFYKDYEKDKRFFNPSHSTTNKNISHIFKNL
jgi:hypothetical protein